LRYNEDIGKYDGRVNEACIALNGLESKGRCNFRAAAAFEEVVLAFRLVIFRQIASGYIP
jgi:hypothetical protein